MKLTQFEFNLPYFPIPEKSETAYSVLCRFGLRFGKNALKLLKHLMRRDFRYSFFGGFPPQLRILSGFLLDGHPWKDVESLLFTNTTLPYFLYFYPKEIMNYWYRKITAPIDAILPLTGLIINRFFPIHPRFCPKCVEDQISTNGFTFFIREHQLPGVLRCHIHHSLLAIGCSVCGPYPIKKIPFCLPGHCYCEDNMHPLYILSDQSMNPEACIWLSEQSAYIMNSKGTISKDIRVDLRHALKMKSVVNGKRINHRKVSAALEKKFGDSLLKFLGYPAWKNGVPHPWIRRLLSISASFRRKSSLQYLLLIGAFYDSVKTFEEVIIHNSDSPLEVNSLENILDIDGNNKNDNIPLQIQKKLETLSIVPNISIIRVASVVGVSLNRIATFYIKKNIKIPLSQKAKSRIGEEKLKRVKEDLNDGISKKDILSKHDFSEWTLTLILMDEPGLYQKHMNLIRERLKNTHRQNLNDYLDNYQNAGRSQIQKDIVGTYEFLQAYDQEWFHNRLPMKQRATNTQRPHRIDWILEDQQRARQLIDFFKQMKLSNDRPFWITKSVSLKSISCSYTKFLANANKYPLTNKILEQHVETREENIKRRIIWALKMLKEDGKILTLIGLRLKSGVAEAGIKKYAKFVIYQSEILRLEISPISFFNGYSDESVGQL